MSKLWYEDEDISIRLQFECETVFWHITIRRTTPSVLKNVLVLRDAVVAELDDMGYTEVYSYTEQQDEKWHKFCKWLGMTPAIQYEENTIYSYYIGE